MKKKKGDKGIKVLYKKDIAGLKMLARTGHVKPDVLKEHTHISTNRINTLLNMKYVEKVYDNYSNDQYLRLTCAGRSYIENQFNILSYKSNSPRHDTVMVDYYMRLNEEEKESWITETELHRGLSDYEQQIDVDVSPTDFCYLRGEELVFVEVITSNYTYEDIQAKMNFVEMSGGTYEQLRL